MVDLIFVVRDAEKWHEENIARNPSHYSFMKYFGPSHIAHVQNNWASGIYYNPFVHINDLLVKYGVITQNKLQSDLQCWDSLYVSGRLHKPVLTLMPPNNTGLEDAIKQNRLHALKLALLQHGRSIQKYHLYYSIAEISYIGDFRMKVGENPRKVHNIVHPNIDEFDKIYLPIIADELVTLAKVEDNGTIVQVIDPKSRFKHLISLPNKIQRSLSRHIKRDPKYYDIEESMAELSYNQNLRPLMKKAITDITWNSSIYQTLQGIVSAGFIKSFKYGAEKLMKQVEAFKKARQLKKQAQQS